MPVTLGLLILLIFVIGEANADEWSMSFFPWEVNVRQIKIIETKKKYIEKNLISTFWFDCYEQVTLNKVQGLTSTIVKRHLQCTLKI